MESKNKKPTATSVKVSKGRVAAMTGTMIGASVVIGAIMAYLMN